MSDYLSYVYDNLPNSNQIQYDMVNASVGEIPITTYLMLVGTTFVLAFVTYLDKGGENMPTPKSITASTEETSVFPPTNNGPEPEPEPEYETPVPEDEAVRENVGGKKKARSKKTRGNKKATRGKKTRGKKM